MKKAGGSSVLRWAVIGALVLGLATIHAASAQGDAAARPARPASAAAAANGPCTLVFGHGRNPNADDAAANQQWDDANRAFASQVALEIAERDIRTVLALAAVTLTDHAQIAQALTDNARREGCDRIVETTLFAEDDELLVVRLREYPLQLSGSTLRIAEPRVTLRQEYPNTQRNRDRLVPATLGKSFAQDYLQRRQP